MSGVKDNTNAARGLFKTNIFVTPFRDCYDEAIIKRGDFMLNCSYLFYAGVIFMEELEVLMFNPLAIFFMSSALPLYRPGDKVISSIRT